MRIQISKDLNKKLVEEQLKKAQIVKDGDYILISKTRRISVYDTDGIVFISAHEIDYIESNKNTIYVYTRHKHYESILKLYEYLDESDQFIRINKSTVINKNSIRDIRSSLNMKFKININDQWLEVNRTYYYEFKDAIGI